MTPSSCLYTGQVVHSRFSPRKHHLRYRVFGMLLDLNEIDSLSERLSFFSRNRFNLAGFHDADHGDGSNSSLPEQARALLRRAGCQTDQLTIKLLCIAASLSGTRDESTDGALIRAFASHPLLTLKVIAGIHWHALRMILNPRQQAAPRAVPDANSQGAQP